MIRRIALIACPAAAVGAWVVALLGSGTSASSAAARAAEPAAGSSASVVDFARDVRPILAERCFACHGPDEQARKAKLRLDTRAGATAMHDEVAAVVPGKPGDSELIRRITSDDPDELMPPEKGGGKRLTAKEVDVLRRWVAQGAPWVDHWSFAPATRPALPEVKDAGWVRNPIDRFVLARLDAAELTPAPEADRRTLARRVALDLTGLPPRPEDVDAFVADDRPDAYERLIDAYLATPEWGEHRGRYWLDAARYADTHGLHNDNYREMWAYREWVIGAFNDNVPFDRFTVEQLAGDLLPNRTLAQQVASGFHRCNITTSEGGSINEEVEANYAKDRVETTATVWLGLTAGCAACHDHKFDPVTQKEFYQLAAFFRNTTQRAMDGNAPDTPPIIVVPSAEDRPAWEKLEKAATELKAARQKRKAEAAGAFDAWIKAGEFQSLAQPLGLAGEHLVLPLDEGSGHGETGAWVDGKPSALPVGAGLSWVDGPAKGTKALRFAEKAGIDVPGDAGAFEADKPFSVGGWVLCPPDDDKYTVASRLGTGKDKNRGWTLEVNGRLPQFRLNGDSPDKDAITVTGGNAVRLQAGKWHHVFVTYDGSRRAEGLSLYVDGKAHVPEAPPKEKKELKGSVRADNALRIGGAAGRDLKGGGVTDFRAYARLLTPDEVAILAKWRGLRVAIARAGTKLAGSERQDLDLLYLSRFDDAYRAASAELAKVDADRAAIKRRSAVTHVMQEKDGGKPMAHVLFRGQYDQPRDKVEPAVPAFLPPLPKDAPASRLALAHWLMAPENPLTARVTVNRFWQEVFGTGLVRTSEDFGNTGEPPSHPELLDWMAVEFREQGWDVKRLFRLMLTSSTYRQAAVTTPAKRERDPQNRLLSRGPRFRLDAEVVRDGALASSGLLVRKVGGPSVKPYQPEGVWEAVAMFGSNTRFYKPDAGDGLYRRSLYWFWKRSAPPASMEIFNAPSREVCTVRRERANTPLQALVTLNDVQFVEAARHLATRALQHSQGTDARLDYVTRQVLARPFDDAERAIVTDSLARLRQRYDANPEAAKKLIAVGASKPEASLDPSELAAWTMIASQVMNLDEALNK